MGGMPKRSAGMKSQGMAALALGHATPGWLRIAYGDSRVRAGCLPSRQTARPPAPAAQRSWPLTITLLAAAAALFCCGCPQYRDPTAPEPVRKIREPDVGRDYLLYVPSSYDAEKTWSLVVLCHGTEPWDTAPRQMGDWTKLAEEKKFIVAAPFLQGTNALMAGDARRQIELQRKDEETILAVVRHVRGAYNISADRIFLTGWSAGNFAVLWTGLRHPELFRALAVLQGNFNSAFLAGVERDIDPYQPVFVLSGSTDWLLGDQPENCIQWLQDNNADVHPSEVAGFHSGHSPAAYEFFERIVRTVPWLQIRTFAMPASDQRRIKFATRGSFEPTEYRWEFGDGGDARTAEPIHEYAEPGTYQVKLTVRTPRGGTVVRTVALTIQ